MFRPEAAAKSAAWALLFESKLRQLVLRVAGDPQCASAQRKRFRNAIFSVSGGLKSSFLQNLTSWKMTNFSLTSEVHNDPRDASKILLGCF